MLVKFKIVEVVEEEYDQKYFDAFGGPEKSMKQWKYKIVGDDGNAYWLFRESKPRLGLLKGSVVRGNARKLENDKFTNWGEYAGAYELQWTRHPITMDAIDTPQKFAAAKKEEIARLEKQRDSIDKEIERLKKL